MKKLLFTFVIASVAFFAGCKKDEYKEKVNECPKVVSTIPLDKAINVPLNQVISATFNVKMDPATITGASFTIQQGATIIASTKSAMVEPTVSYAGLTASLIPATPLSPFTLYTGRVTKSAKDLLGQALQIDHVWTFTTIPLLTLSSLPIAGGTTLGGGTIDQGAITTITATPNPGYAFLNWTENGAAVSITSTYQFTMAGNRTLVANFTAQYAVTLSSLPLAGGTTTGGGTFNAGTSVTITAVPSVGYTFTNWTEAGIAVSPLKEYTFPLTMSRILVANFAINMYSLKITRIPASGGTVAEVPNQITFSHGTNVQLTATPAPDYTFVSWSGDATGTANTATVTMNSDKNVTANFALKTYTLNTPAVNGTVVKSPNPDPVTLKYNSGTIVTLTATPKPDYTFTSWTGDATGITNTATVTMNADKTVTANFTAIQYTVDVKTNPATLSNKPTGAGPFNSGASVTVTAVANDGFTFTNWTDENGTPVSTSSSYTFTMPAKDRTLVANYTQVVVGQFLVTLSSIPPEGGTTSGGGTFSPGASVTVTAVANADYTFTNWTETGTNLSITTADYTFTISGDRKLVANFTAVVIPPSGPLAIDLGCAAPFAILAGSTITSTGPSIVTGNVGLSPGSALEGFLPGIIIGTREITTPIAAAAKGCLTDAFIDGQSRSLNAISLPGQLGGLTLAPGLYSNSSTSGISGTGANGILTLEGNANAVWIFQMGSTLKTDPATSIVLAGGAQAKNIFWIVGSSATLGTTSVFYGNILAQESITLNTGAVLYGRALTQTAAVTLDASTVTKP